MTAIYKNLLLCFSLLLVFSACKKEGYPIIVNASGHGNCLVNTSVDFLGITTNTPVALYLEENGKEILIPCQLDEDETGSVNLYWMLPEKAEGLSYILRKGENKNFSKIFSVTDNGRELIVKKGDKSILQYYHKAADLPEGLNETYSRSGFIHPAWSPAGNVLTNIQPADHRHHYGFWNPWTRVVYDNTTYDLWNIGDGQGTVQFNEMISITEGAVYAGFTAKHDHIIIKEGKRSVIMEELWKIKAWSAAESGREYFMWDFKSELTPSTLLPVLLQAYRYAGFGFRATDVWTKENCIMYTSEGKSRQEIDGTNARWIYLTGEIGNGKSGLLIMAYPENRKYPEPLRIWDENANNGRGDAFINFAPTKNDDWQLEPGSSYTLKYRVATYDGEMTPETAERMWNDFANPPAIITAPE